jgi:membrane fusion protein, multidrug efflux system
MTLLARLTAAGLAALLLLPGCKEETAVAPPVRPVLWTQATVRTSETVGPFAGTIEARYSAAVGFRVFGRLVARDVNIGDLVKAGTRLAALDPAVQTVAVRSAEASVANAQAQVANATAAETRQRELLERNVATQAQFELAQKNRETATAGLVQAKANLTKALDDLAYTQLHSDIDGVVIARDAEIGQVVNAGQPVVTIARPEVKEAVFDLPDPIATALTPDAIFNVMPQLDPVAATTGRVREIAPMADPATRTRRVRLTLADPPESFRLGTTITVALTRTISPRIELPATAVLAREGKSLVWIVDPATSTVAPREVRITGGDQGMVAVTEGLVPGERVVTAGVHSLSPGQAVKILAEARR